MPIRPPRPGAQAAAGRPFVRADAQPVHFALPDAVPAPGVPGLADDACVMAAAGEDEADVGVGLVVDLVYGLPRRDPVVFGAQGVDGHADVAQGDNAAVDLVAAVRQLVVQEELAQILGMHAVRHAGGVRVPCHQVIGRRMFAQQIPAHGARGRIADGPQRLERGGHLAG
ncbi:hypothetical protein D9M68_701140 [compost metagenome]